MAMAIVAAKPGGPEVLEWRGIETRQPGPDEVLLRQTAVGVNFLDTYYRSGLYPWPPGEPLIPGGEAAGVVEAVGKDVKGLAIGDRVAYTTPLGAYREERVMKAERLVKLPPEVSDEVAAAIMLKGLTAHYLLHRTFAVRSGHYVLFHAAAGGVGLIAGQWLAALGAIAIGTVGTPEKAALARRHGYAHVINYKTEDFVARVAEITEGKGVHVVYDSVGKDTYRGSLKSLRRLGHFVSFGQSSGMITDFKLSDLASHGSLSATRPVLFDYISTPGELEQAADALFAEIVSSRIMVQVHQTFPLRDAAEAHRQVESRSTVGSTVLLP
ncbi:MAG TPA: quinone oxidoreductase [Hypericibacter adhaerens]|jgi:NADPH2:quinone reductase|uniref:Quinone oxidoreductase n=1 Tax=Hypericibacter adhaerens TaxID=2602016 RepID=A0A5J6MYS0_9PROT|nr:quinone oxidoreductase [Hypericibacter adhaerens]QEX22888.1 quinone oxidoreductase [Hypericibacter adhaerens]HWA43132.1 quinone oxidoreductase [Hypericibacter adhaerens]